MVRCATRKRLLGVTELVGASKACGRRWRNRRLSRVASLDGFTKNWLFLVVYWMFRVVCCFAFSLQPLHSRFISAEQKNQRLRLVTVYRSSAPRTCPNPCPIYCGRKRARWHRAFLGRWRPRGVL